MKKVLIITFLIIGTIIGAGFASGKEIFVFFNIYGEFGFLGIFISNIIIGAIIYKGLFFIKKNNIQNYQEFIDCMFGKRRFFNFVVKYIINIFLIISFFVMCAGFSSYLEQEYKLPIILGASLIALLNIFILSKGIKGIKVLNNILIPILILLICMLGITKIRPAKIRVTDTSNTWLIKSVLYASYNTIMLFPLLVTLNKYIKSKRQIKTIVGLVFLIFLTLSIIIFFLLNSSFDFIENLEMPMGFIASQYRYLFGVVILGAILTSVTSICYSFLKNLKLNKNAYNIILILISIISIGFSFVGFGKLVEILYPLLGFLGLIQLFFLFKA